MLAGVELQRIETAYFTFADQCRRYEVGIDTGRNRRRAAHRIAHGLGDDEIRTGRIVNVCGVLLGGGGAITQVPQPGSGIRGRVDEGNGRVGATAGLLDNEPGPGTGNPYDAVHLDHGRKTKRIHYGQDDRVDPGIQIGMYREFFGGGLSVAKVPVPACRARKVLGECNSQRCTSLLYDRLAGVTDVHRSGIGLTEVEGWRIIE